jgi:hypothetical protein
MSDQSIAAHIEKLVAEEHELRHREQRDTVDPDSLQSDQARLQDIAVELDRCWDLLRRRRAMADAGGDPNLVEERDAGTVEHYLQ